MEMTKDLSQKKVSTISPESTMLDAYRLMKSKDIRHLPVVDVCGKLVGILSDRDVQRAMICHKISDFQQEVHLANDIKVSDFMNWPVMTVSENTSIQRVASKLLEQKVSALVVENQQGHISGIVTTTDLLQYLVKVIDGNTSIKTSPLSVYLY